MHRILTPCHGTHSIQSNRTTIQPTYKSEYQQPHTPDPAQKFNTQILSVTIPVHSKRSFANTKADTFTWPSLPPTPLHLSDFPPNGRPGTSILPRLASHHIDGVSCHAQNTHSLPWHPFHPIQSYHHPADIQKRIPTTTHTRPGTKQSTHKYCQSLF